MVNYNKYREYQDAENFEFHWSDTPNTHVKTFAAYIEETHLQCADFTVMISNVDKTVFFVRQMDLI